MFDWLKRLVVERLIGLGIGYVVSHAATSGLEAHGVSVDPVKLQASLWAGWASLSHVIESKTAGTRLEWIGKVL